MQLTEKLITISRAEFLEYRRRQVADATESAIGNDDIIAICDPDEEIICDVCNCNVETETVSFNDWGLYCDECATKHKVPRR